MSKDRMQPEEALRELGERYVRVVNDLEEAAADASFVSQAAAGRPSEGKIGWLCILFTRLCVMSVSILKITPRSRFFYPKPDNWDPGSCRVARPKPAGVLPDLLVSLR